MNTQGHLEIPKPCHENWDMMSKQEQGRHCGVCSKVVMDFTAMSTEKVINFISKRKSESICGRFRPDQIKSDEIKSTPNRRRVFMAAVFLVFGGMLFNSCKTSAPPEKMGRVQMESSFGGGNELNLDTPSHRDRVNNHTNDSIGKITAIPVLQSDTNTMVPEPAQVKMGAVQYVPIDTTK